LELLLDSCEAWAAQSCDEMIWSKDRTLPLRYGNCLGGKSPDSPPLE
jgi:hypothetical protein